MPLHAVAGSGPKLMQDVLTCARTDPIVKALMGDIVCVASLRPLKASATWSVI